MAAPLAGERVDALINAACTHVLVEEERKRLEAVVAAGATLSDDRQYRYALWRSWDRARPRFIVIGLNPSTADETKDDPTIRRCIGFAKREGCGSLVMLNLFAFRATRPADMWAAVDPIGPLNDATLRDYATEPYRFAIAAWGAVNAPERAAEVIRLFDRLHCLGRTRDGSPRHPLYLPANQAIERFSSFAGETFR